MPTYDYRCRNCNYEFELFQSIKEKPLETCPRCGKSVRRLIGGGIGIIFKGSGFYTTDYKSSSALSGRDGSGRKAAEEAAKSKSDTKLKEKAEASKTGTEKSND